MLEFSTKYLNIVKTRSEEGKTLERVYRNLRNVDMLQHAYMNLYANYGATTPGSDPDDKMDGISLAKIEELSQTLKDGTFKWKPARRVYIPKANGKERPLGMPSWNDKLVQESIRLVLQAYYEPRFSDASHGFRAGRGCHTALTQIAHKGGWTGTKWFIEGDIKGCFDNIDHEILVGILAEDFKDQRFIKLVREMLSAGYIDNFRYYGTYSGTPQGGVVSPILANVYLNLFDKWVEEVLIPKWTKGEKRQINPEYNRLTTKLYLERKGKRRENVIEELQLHMKSIPSGDPNDPNFRRLRYVRYADDFLLGFSGTKTEANEIKEEIATWLRLNLKLDMSNEKTLVTHAATTPAKFLGYEITAPIADSKQTGKRRATNGKIQLRMPTKVTKERLQDHRTQRSELMNLSDYDIVNKYAAELRGIYNYYKMAINVGQLANVQLEMKYSLVRTLANKHKTTSTSIYKKYKRKLDGKDAIQVVVVREEKKPLVATFGNISCKRKRTVDDMPDTIVRVFPGRNELLARMQYEECEICGAKADLQGHHIRNLAELKRRYQGKKSPPHWVQTMIAMNRKTIVVCKYCHQEIHGGRYDGPKLTELSLNND